MNWLTAPLDLATLHLALTAAALLWNVGMAARITRRREVPRAMALLSGLSGLLVMPALFVLLATASVVVGRALAPIAWVWPLTTALIALQATYALARGLVTPAIGIPIALYDVLLAVVYWVRWANGAGLAVSTPLLGLLAAEASAVGIATQAATLTRPYFLFLPLLAPASPGRPGPGTLLRSAIAMVAVVWGGLVVLAIPAGVHAIRGYARYATERLQERPQGDFTVGLKILPRLSGAPFPSDVAQDLAMADSLGAAALVIYVAPEGATAPVLDSLARVLDRTRSGKVIVVALDFSGTQRDRVRGRVTRFLDARTADVERIARRVRPDYVVPVVDPYGRSASAVGRLPLDTWKRYLRDAAAAARLGDQRVRVMAHVGGFSPRDSALYAWAASAESPVGATALSLFPSYEGAARLDARTFAATRWLAAERSSKPQWVLEAGGYPLAHGNASQALSLWGTLAWATSQRAVRGLVVYQASDYGSPTGLEGAGGRVRPAAAAVRRAIRALAEESG